MSATMVTQPQEIGVPRPGLRDSPPESRRPIVTRAEVSECTCPDACERDHELD